MPGEDHMFSAAFKATRAIPSTPHRAYLDSGAFTDPPHKRTDPEGALRRQLQWEEDASTVWDVPWRSEGVVSYDVLIDETWADGKKEKVRWSVKDADKAIASTIEAAEYLASQRDLLAPRTLILSVQGVDDVQYDECAQEVLKVVAPGDWIGLGGWCILGRKKSLLPTFRNTLYRILPRIADASVTHIHIFGVMWMKPLAELLWLADRYGLTVSTDSTKPLLSCTWKGGPERLKQAGVRCPYWRDNVQWWIDALGNLRVSKDYAEPPHTLDVPRQLPLDFGVMGA